MPWHDFLTAARFKDIAITAVSTTILIGGAAVGFFEKFYTPMYVSQCENKLAAAQHQINVGNFQLRAQDDEREAVQRIIALQNERLQILTDQLQDCKARLLRGRETCPRP